MADVLGVISRSASAVANVEWAKLLQHVPKAAELAAHLRRSSSASPPPAAPNTSIEELEKGIASLHEEMRQAAVLIEDITKANAAIADRIDRTRRLAIAAIVVAALSLCVGIGLLLFR